MPPANDNPRASDTIHALTLALAAVVVRYGQRLGGADEEGLTITLQAAELDELRNSDRCTHTFNVDAFGNITATVTGIARTPRATAHPADRDNPPPAGGA